MWRQLIVVVVVAGKETVPLDIDQRRQLSVSLAIPHIAHLN